MALSEQEKYDYVHNVLINKFHLTQRLNCSSLFDLDGNLLVASEETKKQFGIENIMSVLNKSFNTATDKYITMLTGFTDSHCIEAIRAACKKIFKLQRIVIDRKIPTNFINLIPRGNIFSSRLVTYVPVFHDNGELVALQAFSSNCNLFGINEYLSILQEKDLAPLTINIEEHDLPIKLTVRQHEILFLLVKGLSQRQAADILNISRGNLAKITVESICPKFDIYDADTGKLIDRAIKLNYHKYIPQSLCRPCIILLDHDIIDQYFNGEMFN